MQHPVDCFEKGSDGGLPHRVGISKSLVPITNLIKLYQFHVEGDNMVSE